MSDFIEIRFNDVPEHLRDLFGEICEKTDIPTDYNLSKDTVKAVLIYLDNTGKLK